MKRALLFLVLGIGIIISGCSNKVAPQDDSQAAPAASAEYHKITAEQAKEKMDETEGWILLDVRTDEEFEAEHIEGAVLIPDYEIAARVESELPDKNAVILIYCRSGRRSALAAHEMVDMGYTGAYDFGGIIDWPYNTVSGK